MKLYGLLLMSLLFSADLAAKTAPRITEISGKKEKITNFEIVVEKNLPVLAFAAMELQALLKQATGVQAPIVKQPSSGTFSLILGDSSMGRSAGINPDDLPPEGYYIHRRGVHLFLVGRDDPVNRPKNNSWMQLYKRASLSAVYDFLERFAGVRFFFPGKYGTVVPRRGALILPAEINILERPDMPDRRYYSGKAKWYEPNSVYNGVKGENLELLRLRYSERVVPFGHGLSYLNHIGRFKTSHPEYFAMLPDGSRYFDRSMIHTGQYCFNSGIREVIYQDAKAFLTNQPAASRGLRSWNWNCGTNGCFSAMPQDWLYWCGCPECRKIAEPGRNGCYSDSKQHQAVSNFIWKFTAELADRLTLDGIKGSIAQMAYMPYDLIPDCRIPANVLVQVSVNGLGADSAADRRESELIRSWQRKVNGKVSVWTGSLGKNMSKNLPGIPAMMPKHLAHFIESNRDSICGGFFESETDYFLFNYLNYYILAKKLWNNSADTDKLLEDHYQIMFGPGAPMMKLFFESLEENWTTKILGNTVMTGFGPRVQIPCDMDLWTRIYSPEKLKEYNRLFDAAEKAAAGNREIVGRLIFIRKNLLAPIEQEAGKFFKAQAIFKSMTMNCPGKVYLRPCRGEINEVSTIVQVTRGADSLNFRFECEEPRLADAIAKETARDSKKIYEDSSVELLLNPSDDRTNY